MIHMVSCDVDTHNIEDVERTQGVLGAGKSSAAHVHQQINTINP